MTIATLTGHAIIAVGDKYSVRQKQMFTCVLQSNCCKKFVNIHMKITRMKLQVFANIC